MTFEDFIKDAKRLRDLADKAEAEFMAHLWRGEQQKKMWQDAGFATFSKLLSGENIASATRYSRYKKVIAEESHQLVEDIGLNGAYRAVDIPSDAMTEVAGEEESSQPKMVPARPVFIAEANSFRKRNDVPVSDQHARTMRDKIWQPVRVSRADLRRDALKELKEENAKLKKANAKLTKELEAAYAKIKEAKQKKISRRARGTPQAQ